jgi:hypothetical protein
MTMPDNSRPARAARPCQHRWEQITDTYRLRNAEARLCNDETDGVGRITRAKACELCGCNVALERCNRSTASAGRRAFEKIHARRVACTPHDVL